MFRRGGWLFLFVMLIPAAAQATVVDTMWLRHMVGDSAKRLNQAADIKVDVARNGVYVCGSIEDRVLDLRATEMGLVKYDTAGNYQWRVHYSSSVGSEEDMAHALAIDPATGDVFFTGYTDNYIPRVRDYSYCRYNTNGGAVWQRKSIWNGDDAFYDVAVRGTKLYMCGYRYDPATGQDAYLVARIKWTGGAPETLWTRSYVHDTLAKYSRGRARRDIHPGFVRDEEYLDRDNCAVAVAIDPRDNGVVTAGYAYDSELEYEWWLMKHDTLGNQVWDTTYHSSNVTGQPDDDVAYDVAVDDSGNVYACGFTYWNNPRGYEFSVMKLDQTGSRLHSREYGNNTEGDDDCAYSLCLDDASPQNLYVTGYIGNTTPSGRDVATMKFVTTTMSQVWGDVNVGAQYTDTARIDGEDAGYKVYWAAGKVYVAGVKGGSMLPTQTSDDMLALCYSDANSVGVPKVEDWSWSYDSPDSANTYDDFAATIFAIDTNNVYVAGQCTRDSSSVLPGQPGWPRFYQSMVTARLFNPIRDAAATAILAPKDTVGIGVPVVPRAVVRNVGNSSSTFWSYFDITGGYSDSVLNLVLAPGDSAVDSFASWLPSALGPAVVRCSVALAGDTVASNDVVVETVFVALRDVACSLLVAPVGVFDSGTTVTPQAWLANYGNVAEQFDAVMTIGGFYTDTATVSLAPGGVSLVSFADATLRDRGTWAVACSTMLDGDRLELNNRDDGFMRVRVTDAALVAIEALPDTVDSGAVVTPRLRIANLGTDSAAVRARLVLGHGAVVAYAESVDATLGAGEEWAVDLPSSQPLVPMGAWFAAARVELAADQVPDNDSAGKDFLVVPTSGVLWPRGWVEVAMVPITPSGRNVKDGGCLAVVGLADTAWIYGLKGYKTFDFYRYNFYRNAWEERAPMPTGLEGKPPYKGATMNEQAGEVIYATKGNNTLGFWSYTPRSDSWKQLPDVPLGIYRKKVKGGSDLVAMNVDGRDYVYLMKGYRNEFYRYDIEANTWQTLPLMPVGVNLKWYKGSFLVGVDNRHIYALKGRYNELWRYAVDTDSWTRLASLPLYNAGGRRKKANDGASGAYFDSSIYALKGGNTTEFWRYDTATDVWHQLVNDSLPSFGSMMRKKRVKAGGDMVYTSYALWALKGNKTWEFWRYGFDFTEGAQAPERTGQAASVTRPASGWQFTVAPNPMTGRGVLRYSAPAPALLTVRLYDAAGRVVRTAADSRPAAGSGVLDLDTRGLAAGVYLARVSAECDGAAFETGQRILVVK